ncbi:hypothetical protein [Sphaerisporangium dianthi]|uniref:Uncharacterized protein n=1 Tax=Sphaerisporangium dianthi TaxID=1436120 RepID=A0ABV9CL92_9ACTN
MSFDRHLAEIAREFPEWTIWRSDAGRWWATRHRLLTERERDAGCAMTIDADDPEGLRGRLLEQQRCITALDGETGTPGASPDWGETGPTGTSPGRGETGTPGASSEGDREPPGGAVDRGT